MSECRIPVPCEQLDVSQLRQIADVCYQKNKKRCEENPRPSSCNSKAVKPQMNKKALCSWLKYNPEILTTDDITKQELIERGQKRQQADPEFLERFFGNYQCEYRGDYLDVRDLVYFMEVWGSDPIHQVYYPPCDQETYKNDDFNVVWKAIEDERRGHLYFPPHFPKSLEAFKNSVELQPGNPWLAIFLSVGSDEIEETHSNLLFYYPRTGIIERVEPAGYKFGFYDQKSMDQRFTNYFQSIGLRYLKPVKNLPRQGVANVEAIEESALSLDLTGDPDGFCQTWTYFYLDQKYRHPDWSTPHLFEHITQTIWNSPYTFLEVIRHYQGIMQVYTDKTLKRLGYRKGDLDKWFLKKYKRIAKKFGICRK